MKNLLGWTWVAILSLIQTTRRSVAGAESESLAEAEGTTGGVRD